MTSDENRMHARLSDSTTRRQTFAELVYRYREPLYWKIHHIVITHPIYREMVIKQRVLFDQMHRYHYIDTSVDKACQEAVRMMDENDMEIK